MSGIPVIRWAVAMDRNEIGGFVSYHDYAMLYEQIESLRADMQRRIVIGKEAADELAIIRAALSERDRMLGEAVELLRGCRREFDGLPHSLGYDFTHTPKLDAFLSAYDASKNAAPAGKDCSP